MATLSTGICNRLIKFPAFRFAGGSSVDETDPFCRKLAELVERIQTDLEEDIEVFGTALAKLQAFVEENEGKESNTTLTAVIQHELETNAQENAQRALQAFRTGKQLPALINTFLEAHWAPVLQKIALKSQVGSTDWLTTLETMKNLI